MASGSSSSRSTVWRGCSEPYGSWNTICTCAVEGLVAARAKRLAEDRDGSSPTTGAFRPARALSSVDLPDPDSPTSPKDSPLFDLEG